MNYPMAIVISAALIAGAIFFSNQNDLGAEWESRPYSFWQAVGVDEGRSAAWAVNAEGYMKRCQAIVEGDLKVKCLYEPQR